MTYQNDYNFFYWLKMLQKLYIAWSTGILLISKCEACGSKFYGFYNSFAIELVERKGLRESLILQTWQATKLLPLCDLISFVNIWYCWEDYLKWFVMLKLLIACRNIMNTRSSFDTIFVLRFQKLCLNYAAKICNCL